MFLDDDTESESQNSKLTRRRCKFTFTYRYFIAFMTMFGLFCGYNYRFCFNIGIKHVITPHQGFNYTFYCEVNNRSNHSFVPVSKKTYDWSESVQHQMVNTMLLGICIGHVVGGVTADNYGGKMILGYSVMLGAFINIFIPLVIRMSRGDYINIVVMRGLLGVCMGAKFPAANSILARWTPPKERAKMAAIVYSSFSLSDAFNIQFAESIVIYFKDWTLLFYIHGLIGIIWAFGWHCFCYSDYTASPLCSDAEKAFLKKQLGTTVHFGKKKIPWLQIAKSSPVWAIAVLQGTFIVLHQLEIKTETQYMEYILGFEPRQIKNIICGTALLVAVLDVLVGFVIDFTVTRNYISYTTVIKVCTTFGTMGPAVFMTSTVFTDCARNVSGTMYIFGVALTSCYFVGPRTNILVMAPNFAGFIGGLVHGMAYLPAMSMQFILAKIFKEFSPHEWEFLFYIIFGVMAISNVIYMMFGSAEMQPWNGGEVEENWKSRRMSSYYTDSDSSDDQ